MKTAKKSVRIWTSVNSQKHEEFMNLRFGILKAEENRNSYVKAYSEKVLVLIKDKNNGL